MRMRIWVASTLVLVLGIAGVVRAQTIAKGPVNPAELELTMEVATTNEDGSPQALRFTLMNKGNIAVVLPIPAIDCITGNGRIYLHSKIIAGKPEGGGVGHGCSSGGGHGERTIIETIKKRWFQLQPGEFLVFTGDGRAMLDKSDGLMTYEYWAEYEPPHLSEADRDSASQAGYIVPTNDVVSSRLTFSERWPPED